MDDAKHSTAGRAATTGITASDFAARAVGPYDSGNIRGAAQSDAGGSDAVNPIGTKNVGTKNTAANKIVRRLGKRTAIVLGLLCTAVAAVLLLILLLSGRWRQEAAQPGVSTLTLDDIPFDGRRAYEYLKQLCAIGPRPSGSPGMAAQQKLLEEHFKRLGFAVEYQRFRVHHPVDGSEVPMANMIFRWNPQPKERILLCAHYDTLPFPLLDKENPKGRFVGANDNASGVAVLMELARELPRLTSRYGFDIVMFDAEEFVFHQDGRYFIGSEFFARQYAKQQAYRYRWGILLDMVGDKDLQLYQEGNSLRWKETRPLVEEIWDLARRLGVKEFIPQKKYDINDDHVMLYNLGGIPCIDIIDFDYPPWHTQADTPEQCSPLSLAKVGWVVQRWLQSLP